MNVNADTLFGSPELYFHAFGPADQMTFVPISPEAMAEAVKDGSAPSPVGGKVFRVPAQALMKDYDQRGYRAPGLGWIHHTGHCGANLLARACQDDVRTLVFNEPLSLSQVGGVAGPAYDLSKLPRNVGPMLGFALTMLGKRFMPGQKLLAKGTLATTFLASAIEKADPGGARILLYHRLDNHLRVALRSSEHIARIEALTQELRLSERFPDIDNADVAHNAAGLWLVAMGQLQQVEDANGHSHAVDAQAMFEDFPGACAAVAKRLGLSISDDVIAELQAQVPQAGEGGEDETPSSIAAALDWARDEAGKMGLRNEFHVPLVGDGERLF